MARILKLVAGSGAVDDRSSSSSLLGRPCASEGGSGYDRTARAYVPKLTAGESVNDSRMSRTSSMGVRPNRRLNSRLNWDALS